MSWEQLLAIEAEARDIDAQERAQPPVDCPVCATVLRAGPRPGELFCPFSDHYFWPE